MAARNEHSQYQYRGFGRVARGRGFTLIELVIVVAIIAILASIAVPSYISYITKTRRNAASACLSEYANFMERFYTTNLRYDQDTAGNGLDVTTLDLDCASAQRTGEFYRYDGVLTPTEFTLSATPTGVQASRDAGCGTLGLDAAGVRTVSGPKGVAACWK